MKISSPRSNFGLRHVNWSSLVCHVEYVSLDREIAIPVVLESVRRTSLLLHLMSSDFLQFAERTFGLELIFISGFLGIFKNVKNATHCMSRRCELLGNLVLKRMRKEHSLLKLKLHRANFQSVFSS